MTHHNPLKQRNRRTLLLIIGMPVLVLLSSTTLYYLADHDLIDLEVANKGTLITPPVSFTELDLTDAYGQPVHDRRPEPIWTFAIIGGQQCDDACKRILYLTRQTHIALGKQANQVQRMYLNVDNTIDQPLQDLIDEQHPDLVVRYINNQALADLFTSHSIAPLTANRFFLIDPQGWIMMTYPVDSEQSERLHEVGKNVLSDMKRLLQ